LKDFDAAVTDFERAAKLSPDMAWAYQGLGTAWMYKGHMEKAIENFDRAVSKDPKLAWAYCNRGVAKVYLGNESQAQADFDECVKLRPDLKSQVDRRAELARSLRRITKQE
jgi:tetratricopeptide (TPR) repeat protein